MTRFTRISLPVCLVLLTTGCAEFRAPLGWLGPKEVPRATASNPVNRIVAIWQPAEGQGLNGLPGRGFAGQILFFPAKGETPVAGDGDVRIYVFDDQGEPDEQMKPIHQFDFTQGGWEAQLVKGSLGPAYQVYIPYTRKGTHRAKCSLRIRLQPKVGNAVYSDVINVVLPGPTGQEMPAPIVNTSPEEGAQGPVQSIRLAKAERITQPNEPASPVTIDPTTTPAATADPRDARIDRLERLIEQLATAHAADSNVQVASHRGPEREVVTEPSPIDERSAGPFDGSAPDDARDTAHPLGSGTAAPRRAEVSLTGTTTTGDTVPRHRSTSPVVENRRYRLNGRTDTNRHSFPGHDRLVPSEPIQQHGTPRILDGESGWRTGE